VSKTTVSILAILYPYIYMTSRCDIRTADSQNLIYTSFIACYMFRLQLKAIVIQLENTQRKILV